jgi:hypothetical protein
MHPRDIPLPPFPFPVSWSFDHSLRDLVNF